MTYAADLTERDAEATEAFNNFMSWGLRPGHIRDGNTPVCVWAYMLGYSQWCPPKGEL